MGRRWWLVGLCAAVLLIVGGCSKTADPATAKPNDSGAKRVPKGVTP
jgi:hypothetical protein